MNRPIRLAIAALAVSALVACSGQGGGGAAPTTAAPTPVGTTTTGPATTSPTSPVPSAADLAGSLVTPADLGPGWIPWEGFTAWPGGEPGVIPDDQRALLPKLDMCPSAGEKAVALAEGLPWQAFTQLHQETSNPFATMVVAQQLLLADEPDRTAETFTTLRDGLTRCLTENLPAGDWEIGRRERLQVPAVGQDRYAERTAGFEAGGARRDTRLVLVQDGPVLMAIRIDEVLISPDAEATLPPETVNALVSTMADKLP